MTLPNPTVTLCARCGKMIRDERPTPLVGFTLRYDACATCRSELAWPTNELRTGVENPLVKTARPPSLPSSSTAAASPVPDRDGIFLADDDGDSLVFDVRLVMTVRTIVAVDGSGARCWTGSATLHCGGSKRCAELDYHGTVHDYGFGAELVKAIEAEIAARQPRKGDEP